MPTEKIHPEDEGAAVGEDSRLVANTRKEDAISLNAVTSLTEREAKILLMRSGFESYAGHSLKEIGKQFNLSRERIRQIDAIARRKLHRGRYRDRLGIHQLR